MECEKLHGQLARDMENKDTNNTWRCMRKSDLKGCTQSLIFRAKEQSIPTTSNTILTKLPS